MNEELLQEILENLNEVYKDIKEDKKLVAQNLIEEAAFYKMQIEECKRDLLINGAMEEMPQGAYTIKRENPAAKAMREIDAKYTKRLEMLGKLLNEEDRREAKDALDELLGG